MLAENTLLQHALIWAMVAISTMNEWHIN